MTQLFYYRQVPLCELLWYSDLSEIKRSCSIACFLQRQAMKQIYVAREGGPEVLKVRQVNEPSLEDDQVLIRVAATTVNRLDLFWRMTGENKVGLECSGEICDTGRMVTRWRVGDKVCALVPSGGAYAELVVVSARLVIPAPTGISLEHAAALPCAGTIIWLSFFVMNRLRSGQRILIHGGAGGVGSLAIQVAKYYGCEVFVTAGTEKKLQFCKNLGADMCISSRRTDLDDYLRSVLGARGVDYILDCVGEKNFHINLNHLAFDGKLIVIGFEGEGVVYMDTTVVADKMLQVMGANVRTTSLACKERLLKSLEEYLWPAIAESQIKPHIYASFNFSDAARAHGTMEENHHMGKILLIPNGTN